MTNSQKISNKTSNLLADRILQGANSLAEFAEGLNDSDWQKPVISDGRSIGVVIHHVASTYPLEIELAKILASGQPITNATKDVVDKMNADHAKEYARVGKRETLELLRNNSKFAADSVRGFTNSDLVNSGTVSLNANAPLTAQFFIEDHSLRHSFHHLARLKLTLNR